MKRFAVFVVVALSLTASPRALLPQDLSDRVRVRTDGGLLIGQIVGVHANGLDLALDGFELAQWEGPFHSVTRTDIRLLERSRVR